MDEHRKHERFDSRLRCWCESNDVTFYARVDNISEGGLFLKTSTPLPSGVRTQLRFSPQGESDVETEAVVVWTRSGGGMGLKFEGIGTPQLDGLRMLISEGRAGRATPK